MSSSCYFQFKSQKEPTRVTFDGTGISVFELKREIINISKLGDGSDFDLNIYNKDSNEEYDDDTAIVPRSTSVIARRLPASKPGQGRAARYVSGRMPVSAKNSHRTEISSVGNATGKVHSAGAGPKALDKAQTEEERIAAVFQMGADQWEEQKQLMAGQQAVYRPGGFKQQKPGPDPDAPLPAEYVCYRCGVKGHHIRNCPTNNDPKFDGKPRVVRTVGIPKSFLQQIEKPAEAENDGLTDESRQPSSRWVDAEGNAVAALPDSASWAQYQAKAEASAAKTDNTDATGSKELQDRGLECAIDKRLFVDPVKTPCCGKTYCHECIENALINSDLVCPSCSTEGVLLDNLVPDDDTIHKIKQYQTEQASEKSNTAKEKSPSPTHATADVDKAASNSQSPSPANGTTSRPTSAEPSTKKRPAEDELSSDRIPTAPAAMRSKSPSTGPTTVTNVQQMPEDAFVAEMNKLAGTNGMPAFPGMGMPPMPGMMGMPPNMMMNPMMMMNMGMGMPGMPGMPGMMPGMAMPGMGMPGMMPGMGMGMGMPNMGFPQMNGNGNFNMGNNNGFQNFPMQQPSHGEGPYMRAPVNPNRGQGRGRRARPTDYREV